jgi:hypothetical protein
MGQLVARVLQDRMPVSTSLTGIFRHAHSWLTYLVTIGALAWLLFNPLIGSVAVLLQRARISPILFALALIAVLQWLRAWRFSMMLTADYHRSPSWAILRLTCHLSFLNLALPFKVGDLSFPLLAKRALGTRIPHAAGTMLWCRSIDLFVVVGLLLLYGALSWSSGLAWGHRQLILGAASSCLLAPLALPTLVPTLLGLFGSRPALQSLRDGLAESTRLLQGLGGRVFCLGVTMVIWFTHGWICYLAAVAVAGDLTFVAAALAAAASNLAFALPVTGVAGLGPPQAAWSAVLLLLGADWDVAVASALMVYGCLVLGSFLTATATGLWPLDGLRLNRFSRVAGQARAHRAPPSVLHCRRGPHGT